MHETEKNTGNGPSDGEGGDGEEAAARRPVQLKNVGAGTGVPLACRLRDRQSCEEPHRGF
eukprot:9182059-Pyramimonas_sp.AAC.1